jgi:hypothetical protein
MSTVQERPPDDPAKRAAAARVRDQWPGWVVIWVPRKSEFQARPNFPAPANTVVAGRTPEELTAGMSKVRPNPRPGRRNP